MSNTEIVVVGAGVAGLSAALAVAGTGHDVTLVTKAELVESNTYHAQGGIAAAIFSDDDPKLHAADTMAAGHGLCDPKAVDILTREGAERVREFAAAGVKRPDYGITGWVILTLIQHGTPSQIERFVEKALRKDEIWCQLFSEPSAGSDAAAVKTRATRVDGGWKITGQKVWTSGAHYCKRGLATVRTDFDVPKHQGITMVILDMEAPGVEVRPLRQITGGSEFNEVFFNDVFVPDEDVVGEPNAGWTVARATLGNERVSIGGGAGGIAPASAWLVDLVKRNGDHVIGAKQRGGRFRAEDHALRLLNLRRVVRGMPARQRVYEEIKARVKRLADARHRTSHWLMREAITQYVDREEKREAFRQDTLKAWEDKTFCKDKLGLSKPLGKIDRSKLNVNGSSLAAGHPFAATGGRIVANLAKMLEQKGSGRGLISICAAGGQGVVAILER